MLSLNHTYDLEELKEFDERVRRVVGGEVFINLNSLSSSYEIPNISSISTINNSFSLSVLCLLFLVVVGGHIVRGHLRV
jgi:hypothetical protein